MVTDDDIVELLVDTIKGVTTTNADAAVCGSGTDFKSKVCPVAKYGFFLKEKYINSSTSLPKGRIFYTEREIRQMIKGGVREITVPANAIISPLAQETLNEKGIRVVRS